MDKWQIAQEWEANWWSDCTNTIGESFKQVEYAKWMGLEWRTEAAKLFIDLEGKSVVDIGGGPDSLLLKCINRGNCAVIDPCNYPKWTLERYGTANIAFVSEKGESIGDYTNRFDEAWIYNCLQHTENPELVIKNAKKLAKKLRIFEWIEIEANIGHLHVLKADKLSKWIGKNGKVTVVNSNGARGLAFYGEFEL